MLSWSDFLNVFLGKKKIDLLHFDLSLKSCFFSFVKSSLLGLSIFFIEVFVAYFLFLAFSESLGSLLKKSLFGFFSILLVLIVFFVVEFLFYYAWSLLHYFIGKFFCGVSVSKDRFVLSSLYLFSCVNFVKKLFLAVPFLGWLFCPLIQLYSVVLYHGFIKRFFSVSDVKAWIVIVASFVVLFSVLLIISLVVLLIVLYLNFRFAF